MVFIAWKKTVLWDCMKNNAFWYRPNRQDNPMSWECWTGDVRKEPEHEMIGYVDLLYTTLERNKYLATFSMSKHPDQQELSDYFFDVEEAKNFVESSYVAFRMIGTLDEPE